MNGRSNSTLTHINHCDKPSVWCCKYLQPPPSTAGKCQQQGWIFFFKKRQYKECFHLSLRLKWDQNNVKYIFSRKSLLWKKYKLLRYYTRSMEMFQWAGSDFWLKHKHSLPACKTGILTLCSAGSRWTTFCAEAVIYVIVFIHLYI